MRDQISMVEKSRTGKCGTEKWRIKNAMGWKMQDWKMRHQFHFVN